MQQSNFRFQDARCFDYVSKSQKLLLVQPVRDHKALVLAPFSSTVTKKAKQQAKLMVLESTWIALKLCGMLFGQKFAEAPSKKSDVGGSGELSELDETALNILGWADLMPKEVKSRSKPRYKETRPTPNSNEVKVSKTVASSSGF